VRGFEDLLARYPNGEFADNARYWLGDPLSLRKRRLATGTQQEVQRAQGRLERMTREGHRTRLPAAPNARFVRKPSLSIYV